MKFNSSAEKVLQEVTERTGIPVEVVEDITLTTIATVSRARPGIPFHLIRVNPSRGPADYIVALQCGFILRQSALPEEDQWDFGPSPYAVPSISRMLLGPGGLGRKVGMSNASASQFAGQLAAGLLGQLRSIPLSLRIDSWIRRDFDELHGLQEQLLLVQVAENVQALAPRFRDVSPPTVWKANAVMNAAYAVEVSRIVDRGDLVLPYEAAGLLGEAEPLTGALRTIDEDPAHDRELIEAWGKQLGINDWYQFIPVRDIP